MQPLEDHCNNFADAVAEIAEIRMALEDPHHQNPSLNNRIALLMTLIVVLFFGLAFGPQWTS